MDLRRATASQEVPLGIFVDETDGKTAETALTIADTDIKIWKTGATTLANKTLGGATHISGGVYYTVFDATDTDTIGPLTIFVHVAGALPVVASVNILHETVYDAKYGSAAFSTLDATGVRAAVGLATANTDAQLATIASYIDTEITAIDDLLDTEVAAIKTVVDAILVDTAEIGVAGAGLTNINLPDQIMNITGSLAGNVSGSVGSVTGAVGSVTGPVTVGTNNDKADYALSSAAVQAIWDALTSALTTVGSIGKKLADWVIGTTQTGDSFARLGAPTGASVSADIAAVKGDSSAILVDTAEIGVAGAGLTNINLPDQIMNITGDLTGNLSGNVGGNVVGSIGSVGTAGISPVSLTASALNAMADAYLDRNEAAGTDSGTNSTALRTPRQALRALRNKVTIVAGVATVMKEDDVTPSWTASVSTAAGNPISGVDPA